MTTQALALLDREALYRAIDAERKRRAWSWREVAGDMGIQPSTLTRLRQNRNISVDGYLACAKWLGIEVPFSFLAIPGAVSR